MTNEMLELVRMQTKHLASIDAFCQQMKHDVETQQQQDERARRFEADKPLIDALHGISAADPQDAILNTPDDEDKSAYDAEFVNHFNRVAQDVVVMLDNGPDVYHLDHTLRQINSTVDGMRDNVSANRRRPIGAEKLTLDEDLTTVVMWCMQIAMAEGINIPGNIVRTLETQPGEDL